MSLEWQKTILGRQETTFYLSTFLKCSRCVSPTGIKHEPQIIRLVLLEISSTLSKAVRLNGFNICFNMRPTQLLNQMSVAFEPVVQHCWRHKKMSEVCWNCDESNLNWFKLSFSAASTVPLFLKMALTMLGKSVLKPFKRALKLNVDMAVNGLVLVPRWES